MTEPLLELAGVGKDYAKVETRGGRLALVWDLLRGRGAAHAFVRLVIHIKLAGDEQEVVAHAVEQDGCEDEHRSHFDMAHAGREQEITRHPRQDA